uniref:Uncharacterized protein n=1 Tax=Aegilops tauschii subsp. strangulata TaxID=200361 RepID=A0A453BJ75_AEGTS
MACSTYGCKLSAAGTSDEIYIHQLAVTFEEATNYCKSEVACTSNGEVFLFHDMTKFSQLFDFIVLPYVYLYLLRNNYLQLFHPLSACISVSRVVFVEWVIQPMDTNVVFLCKRKKDQ